MAGLLDIFGSGDPYGSALSPEQQQALKNQAMLAAGIQMLMSSSGGPGESRPALGNIIGQGFAAGSNTYGNAAKNIYDMQNEQQQRQIQQLMTQMKIDEYRRKVAMQDQIAAILGGSDVATPTEAGPVAAAAPSDVVQVGDGVEMRAVPSPDGPAPSASGPVAAAPAAPQGPMNAKQKKAAMYRKVADAIAAADPEKAQTYYTMADKLDPLPEYGSPQEAMVNGHRVLVAYDKQGNPKMIDGVQPAISLPSEVGAVEYITGNPLAGTGQQGMDAVGNYNKSKAVNVNIGQDKTFSNEMDLRKEFSALPIAKAFTEVQTAYDQIRTALKNPSPANDMAAATKFMKLLDPGSVVRESELNMAMNATGLWDRVQNYYKLMLSGEKLTPKQRKDFYAAAEGLYRAAEGRYAPEVQRYRGMASGYNLNPENVAAPPTAAPAATAAPEQTPVKTYNPKTGKWE